MGGYFLTLKHYTLKQDLDLEMLILLLDSEAIVLMLFMLAQGKVLCVMYRLDIVRKSRLQMITLCLYFHPSYLTQNLRLLS